MQRLHRIVRAALAALLVFIGVNAHALVEPSQRWMFNGSGNASGYVYGSAQAACDGFLANRKAALPQTWTWTTAVISPSGGGAFNCVVSGSNPSGPFTIPAVVGGNGAPSCPPNSTAVTGGCQCQVGYKESGNQCVPDTNPCTAKSGTSSIVNWTTGWTRSANDNDFGWVGGPAKYPGFAEAGCSGGCSVEVDGTKPEGAWVSQTPTTEGLYRNSGDYMAKFTGAQCTPSAQGDPLNPQAENVKCPGYVGEGPSGIGCYGTAQQPVHISNVPRPQTPSAGNPAAGAKPTSGEGSGTGSVGRTPSTGTGGNSGGPAAAGQGGTGGGAGGAATKPGTGGGTGGGTGDGTEPPKPCGAPGQPICNVKVDESGTATSSTRQQEYETEVVKLETEQKNLIMGAGTAASQSVGNWGFGFALPSGCSAFVLSGLNVTVDPCQWQGMVHDLMAMIWLAATAWCCIGMVGRTISGGS